MLEGVHMEISSSARQCASSGLRQAHPEVGCTNALAYHTRQTGSRTMGAPALQLKAFWNSGMFDTTPLVR